VSRAALLLVVICLPLLASCGEEPDNPPRIFEVRTPHGSRPAEFPEAGMTFTRPRNWTIRRRELPGVFELVSGEAVVVGWAYTRVEPLPETAAQLEGARNRLIGAIRERDPDYRVERAVVREVAGAPAIDVRGEQVVSRETLSTRSIHVYQGDVEYVIEAIAPPADYDVVERGVLTPLLGSLELTGEVDEDVG
jgi:hypothetical protein